MPFMSSLNFEKLIRMQPQLLWWLVRSSGGIPHDGLYGEAPPERGTFFSLRLYNRVGISQVEVYGTVGKSVIKVFKGLLIKKKYLE